MGLIGKLWVKLGLDSSEFKRGINDADQATTSFKDRLKAIGQAVGVAFGVGAIVQFGRKVIQTRGEFESLEISFRTLLKSKAAADALMAQMVDLAARTPFSLQQVATGAKQLLAYGFAASEVRGTLSKLGDVAAGLGLPMERLTYLYGTTRTQGRLFARDLMQFTTSGVPLLDELAKMFGKSTEEINKMVSAGDIGFEQVKQAFSNMTGESGKFYNLMEERSKGISGKISNLGDAISVMFNNIGKSQEGGINSALDAAKFLVDNYQEVWRILKTLIAVYGTYKATLIAIAAVQKAKVIWDTVAAFNASTAALRRTTQAQILLNRAALANPYVLLASAIAGVVGALVLFGKEAKSTEDIINDLDTATKDFSDNKGKIEALANEYEILKNKTNRTEQENNRLNEVMKLLAQSVPAATSEFDKYGKILTINTQKVKEFSAAQKLALKRSVLDDVKRANTQLAEIDKKIKSRQDIFQKGSFTRQKQIYIGGEAITTAETETVSYSEEAIAAAAKEANKLYAEREELAKKIASAQNVLLEIQKAESDTGEKVGETYRERGEILANIKATTAEISVLEAKPKKSATEIKNLEALRGELKTYEEEYKTFTGKEFGAKVKVETDKDQLKNAAEGSIAYFENEISKRQLAIKLSTNNAEIKKWQKEIAGFEATIKAKLEIEAPKTERQTIEDAIKGYEDLQIAIPVRTGSPEELKVAQAEWDRLQGLIKQAREELEKFPKAPKEIFPTGSIADFDQQIADIDKTINTLTGSELAAAQAARALLEVQKKGAESGWQTELEQEIRYLNLLKKTLEEATEAQKQYAQEAVDAQQVVVDNLDDSKKTIQQFNDDVSAALEAGATAGIVALGTAIGELAMGQSGGDVWAILLAPIADMAIQLGELAIATGIAMLGIKAAFESMDPFVAIAAGVALVALGTIVKGAISNMSSKGPSSTGGNNNTFTGGYSNGSSTRTADSLQLASPQKIEVVVTGEIDAGGMRVALLKEEQRRSR